MRGVVVVVPLVGSCGRNRIRVETDDGRLVIVDARMIGRVGLLVEVPVETVMAGGSSAVVEPGWVWFVGSWNSR